MCDQVCIRNGGKEMKVDRELLPLLEELRRHGIETSECCYSYDPGVAMLTIATPEGAFRFLAAADVPGREAVAELLGRIRAGCVTCSAAMETTLPGIGNGAWQVMVIVLDGEGESLGIMADEDLPYIPLMDAVTVWVSIRLPQGDVPIVLEKIRRRLGGAIRE